MLNEMGKQFMYDDVNIEMSILSQASLQQFVLYLLSQLYKALVTNYCKSTVCMESW